MGLSVIRRHCPTCQQPRPFQREGPNHILHLILTLITAGLWLFVWIFLVIANKAKAHRCQFCGGTK